MPKLSLRLLFAWVLILVLCHGCLPGAGIQEVEAEAILFADDFSNSPSGWGIYNRDGAHVEYAQGGLRILVNNSHSDFWSVAGKNFADVQIEVDATLVSGSEDNDYGIICRYQDRDNFYMLIISSDGYYGVAKRKNGQYGMIGPDQLQYSSHIVQGPATNHLRASCIGDRLDLYANDQKLIEVTDADFKAGDVGLVAGSYKESGVEVLFDNFMVRKAGY